jgi:hypothetical protein
MGCISWHIPEQMPRAQIGGAATRSDFIRLSPLQNLGIELRGRAAIYKSL